MSINLVLPPNHLSQLGVHTRSNLETRIDRKQEGTERSAQTHIHYTYNECIYNINKMLYNIYMYVHIKTVGSQKRKYPQKAPQWTCYCLSNETDNQNENFKDLVWFQGGSKFHPISQQSNLRDWWHVSGLVSGQTPYLFKNSVMATLRTHLGVLANFEVCHTGPAGAVLRKR